LTRISSFLPRLLSGRSTEDEQDEEEREKTEGGKRGSEKS
jgi:hypothetical protein